MSLSKHLYLLVSSYNSGLLNLTGIKIRLKTVKLLVYNFTEKYFRKKVHNVFLSEYCQNNKNFQTALTSGTVKIFLIFAKRF